MNEATNQGEAQAALPSDYVEGVAPPTATPGARRFGPPGVNGGRPRASPPKARPWPPTTTGSSPGRSPGPKRPAKACVSSKRPVAPPVSPN